MSKNKVALWSALLLSILSICVNICLVSVLFLQQTPNPNKVFLDSLKSVVELKASSGSIGESIGTAVFVSSDGLLVTNAHVVTYEISDKVYTFDEYAIRFADSDEYLAANLLDFDKQLDIATLKIDNSKSKSIKIANSKNIKYGDTVYSIGNSLNQGISIMKGVVSNPLLLLDYGNYSREVIRCDLTITEGNSGGALVNEKGELIGITTFRLKDKSGNIEYGIAYCIPSNVVTKYIFDNVN